MNEQRRRKSQSGSLKRKSSKDNSLVVTRRPKSLLLQHSQSLNIPVEELSQASGLNCFLNLPDRVFSLTYLTENDTQNPESLNILEDFKKGNWQAYLVGLIHNFTYQPAQRKSLEKAITSRLKSKFQNSRSETTFHTQISTCRALSPTENDSEALKITVTALTETKELVLYMGFLMSWCSPVKERHPFLPLLLCRGGMVYRDVVHSVVSEKFDVIITCLRLAQEELRHLSTFCLIMLDENDSFTASFTYKLLHTGDQIKVASPVQPLLKLWNKIHQDDSTEIDIEEIMLYHEALDQFYESVFAIKLGCASLKEVKVSSCFCLEANSKMRFKSTKVIYVVLKYLNLLAVKRLQIKTLNHYFEEGNLGTDTSVISH